MRKLIIAILLLLSVAAYAEIEIIHHLKIKNDAAEIVADMTHIGDATTDSCIDMDDDGRIDLRRLELTGYFLHPALWGYIDTTTAKISTATLADSANGGSARAQSTQGFRGITVTDDTPADGEILVYEADSSRWIMGAQSGGGEIKWRDSSYVYLDTANILGGNTEIKAWLDTTAVRVPIADSTHGGATRATIAKVSDSTDSPFRAAAHDTLYANTPGYLTSETGDIEGVTAGTGLSGGGTTGTVTLNHASHTGDVTGATELTITAQTIKPDDIDTTGEDFVFAQVYKGMSSNSDSQLVTIETIEDSLTGYLINSGNDTINGSLYASVDLWAGNNFYIDHEGDDALSYMYFHGTDACLLYYAAGPYFGFTERLEMANHAINGLVWPTADSSAVHKRFVQVEIEDSLDEYYDSTKVASRAAEEIGDSLVELWQRIEYYIVNARFVHGRADKSGDSVILSLEAYDEDTCDTYIYRDSSTAADQTDTAYINFGNLPYGVTKCDSLILTYRSSSATTTTSCIANIRLYLDGVPQWEHTIDEASVTNERLALYPNDADFDAGELAVVQIIFVGDANAWIKVVSAYLFCSG